VTACPLFETLVAPSVRESPGALSEFRATTHRARCASCHQAAIRLDGALGTLNLPADMARLEAIPLLTLADGPLPTQAEELAPNALTRLIPALALWGVLVLTVVTGGAFLGQTPAVVADEFRLIAGGASPLACVMPLLCPMFVVGLLAPALILRLACREGQCLI
jgi:hypothetical protein